MAGLTPEKPSKLTYWIVGIITAFVLLGYATVDQWWTVVSGVIG